LLDVNVSDSALAKSPHGGHCQNGVAVGLCC